MGVVEAAIDHQSLRVDSALPHTRRLPASVYYHNVDHAIHCMACETRYSPSFSGLVEAIECCGSLAETNRDDVPICDLHLGRNEEFRRRSAYSDAQFMLTQAVYNVQRGRYDPLEYDLARDSMLRLHEYVGIDDEAVRELLDDGIIRKDTDHPHRLYSVTPAGRALLGEAHAGGTAWGHGEGDLEESSQHIMGVVLVDRFLNTAYVDDPDSDVVLVERYHQIDENRRLDAVGLDADGEIVVTVEVERINHDVRRAVPEDFDKMAACQPREAIWVAMSHAEAHEILAALNDPLDGEPRVEKTYAKTTPTDQYLIDEPGFTAIYTVDQLRKRLGID